MFSRAFCSARRLFVFNLPITSAISGSGANGAMIALFPAGNRFKMNWDKKR
jgi:hypothetical protein